MTVMTKKKVNPTEQAEGERSRGKKKRGGKGEEGT